MDWFLYDNGLRHERVNEKSDDARLLIILLYKKQRNACVFLLKKTKKEY